MCEMWVVKHCSLKEFIDDVNFFLIGACQSHMIKPNCKFFLNAGILWQPMLFIRD